jgi:hypothetical protein
VAPDDLELLDTIVDQLGAIAQMPEAHPHLRNLYANLEELRGRLTGED